MAGRLAARGWQRQRGSGNGAVRAMSRAAAAMVPGRPHPQRREAGLPPHWHRPDVVESMGEGGRLEAAVNVPAWMGEGWGEERGPHRHGRGRGTWAGQPPTESARPPVLPTPVQPSWGWFDTRKTSGCGEAACCTQGFVGPRAAAASVTARRADSANGKIRKGPTALPQSLWTSAPCRRWTPGVRTRRLSPPGARRSRCPGPGTPPGGAASRLP